MSCGAVTVARSTKERGVGTTLVADLPPPHSGAWLGAAVPVARPRMAKRCICVATMSPEA